MKGLYHFIKFLLFAGMVLLAFLFAVNNTTEVSLWIGRELQPVSIGVLLIVVFILGGFLGLVLGLGIFRQLKYVLEIRQLRSQVKKLQEKTGVSSSDSSYNPSHDSTYRKER